MEPDVRGRDLRKFFRALSGVKNGLLRDFNLICMFTGEQKSKVLEMQWQGIDLDRGVWHIPQRKRQPRPHWLAPEAGAILLRRQAAADSAWVFPSASISGHLEGVDKTWYPLVRRSGIKDLRLNDLRNCRQNIDHVRAAMAEHYYAPIDLEAKEAAAEQRRQAAEQRRQLWKAEPERKDAAIAALANPIERPATTRGLELSLAGESSAPTVRQ